MTLSIDEILAANDANTTSVECPEWGGVVHLTTMASAKFDELEARLTFAADNPAILAGLRAEYVAACMCDEGGRRRQLTPAQVKKLGEKSPVVIGRLFEAAQRVNSDIGPAEKN